MPIQVEQYSYFMLRIRRTASERPGEPPELEGLVEHLGTGEKRPFLSGEELLLLVGNWCGRVRIPFVVPAPEPHDPAPAPPTT
ncbi:MAG TPA: hypothetical protein VGR37_03380 [Longimicrobiaceae bacterium]|nr:hypothetical protein [Longimicrobiaceae bacterium]